MTSLNRDRVATDFRKVKDLLTKTLTFAALGKKVNVNTIFLKRLIKNKKLSSLLKTLCLRLLFSPRQQKYRISQGGPSLFQNL